MKTIAMRFAAVGAVNTLVDFVVFVILTGAGTPVLLANLISTSAGLALSFFANRRFTFRAATNARQAFLFFGVTGAGLWIVQPAVILVAGPLLSPLVGAAFAPSAAKAFAIAITAVCNFIIYSRAVFATPSTRSDTSSPPLPSM